MILSRVRPIALCCCLASTAFAGGDEATHSEAPHLVHGPKAAQLFVHGKPFLVIGGEVDNSSSSSLDYMRPLWPRFAARHLNTVLVPVTWEQTEPEEGKFNFTLVDGLIESARANRLHLVLLWFGTWKNMVSSYAPQWVRGDPDRFPLTVDDSGNWLPVPSTFGANTRASDMRAFGTLMKHLRLFDAAQQTVVMVQVENEVGLPDSSRDHSAAAQAAFEAPVPRELTQWFSHPDKLTREFRAAWREAGGKTSGSWTEVFGFGPLVNELFMAWHYALYVGDVAAAGHAEYPLPFFVNAAIGRKNGLIGSYPGGGAVPLAFSCWHIAAPCIAILAPDIYYGNFPGWCDAYTQVDNTLFIPETNGGEVGAANAFLAIGRWNAIGISPYGIDDHALSEDEYSRACGLLGQMAPLILAHQATGSIAAALLNQENPAESIILGGYTLHVVLRRDRKTSWVADRGYLMAIAEQPNKFIVAGKDVQVTFDVYGGPPGVVELGQVEEGEFLEGCWVPGRRLNGDSVMLDYNLSNLAAKNQTGTGLRFGQDGPSIIRAAVFRREPSRR